MRNANLYIPKQHGAWAMLILPLLFGVIASNPTWRHALLFAAWLLAYLFAHAFLQWVRTKRKPAWLGPLRLYGGLLLPAGAALLALEPSLVPLLPLAVPLILVNLYFAKRNRERAFLNDLAAVILFSLMTFAAFRVGGGTDTGLAFELFALSVLYFTGTIFYVKTMIREKHDKAFYRYSVLYHAAFLAAVALLYPPALIPAAAVLLVRAIVMPRLNPAVKTIGMLEIAYSALVLVSAWAAY
ncbi:MAG: hypothetical protein A9Z00_10915 [Thermobacillus sp. ZCTH02-B1]|uniref:YwiC-like family protein n=1 Tax=Thermobacillus sp. ZCTH02-B1 TaxID=1858795 RepID=UPI000B570194|nr:YwiC-like family protein [Thermobacillus sp. ZCTH02-B1]OUM94673.1 MAG: hypothetical protein A9Z00_10915 [Thermobacillus sp. ZCTH02-B1]